MHDVRAGQPSCHRDIDAQRLQRPVRRAQSVGHVVGLRAGLVARAAPAVHPDVQTVEAAQRADQLGDMHTGAAVHLGWVLPGEYVCAHSETLALGVRNVIGSPYVGARAWSEGVDDRAGRW